jgi:hypothetical protein
VCGLTPIFPKGAAVCPGKSNKLTRPLVAIVLFCFMSLSSEETLLQCIPLVWKVTFDDSETADLNDRICTVKVVRVAGQKPVLDTLCNGLVYSAAVDVARRWFWN